MAPGVNIAEPDLTVDDITVGHVLQGDDSSSYTVLEFLGEGVFGKVAKCLNVQMNELVAVKILFKSSSKKADKEVSVLETLRVLDSDAFNVVKFFGKFVHRGLICLVFEIMETDMLSVMESQSLESFALCDIRPIVKQLLVTLEGLKGLRLIHADLKWDNIMLPKVKEQPLRVKVIDFGEALRASEVTPGLLVQPCGARCPEVFLGNRFNESIDVFNLGCELAFLYLGYHPFPIDCDYQMVKRMVELLGYPPNKLLSNGVYTRRFFKRVDDDETGSKTWRLHTAEEYERVTRMKPEEPSGHGWDLSSLDDIIYEFPKEEEEEYQDRIAFADLLKGLMHPDPSLRLSPNQALQHCFVTMSHLHNANSTKYLEQSRRAMQVCSAGISKQRVPFEVISAGPEERTTTEDPPNNDPRHSPALVLLNSGDRREARFPEAAKPFDRGEVGPFHVASWWEESCSSGSSPEVERSVARAHRAQFDDWWCDAGGDGVPNKEIKTTLNRSADREEAGSKSANTNGSQEVASLDLLDRNSEPETRDDCQDNGTRTTSAVTVQPTNRSTVNSEERLHLPKPDGNDALTFFDMDLKDPEPEDAGCCRKLLDFMLNSCKNYFPCDQFRYN